MATTSLRPISVRNKKATAPQRLVICTERVNKSGVESLAWLEGDKCRRATSTSQEEFAARNLALRLFFGTALRREFPDDPNQITVHALGEHRWEAVYVPSSTAAAEAAARLRKGGRS